MESAPRSPLRHAALLLALVGALASWLYLARLDQPRAPVWDETWYITFVARYHQGQTQFSSHPPLGTMLIAAGDMASGHNAKADWHRIGAEKSVTLEAMPRDFDYGGPRLAPALFGIATALLFALLAFQLTGSAPAAFLLSLLVLADSALLVQFRTAQLDAFQLAFVIAALLAAVRAQQTQSVRSYLLLGLFIALAALVRANALVLGAIAPILLWPLLRAQDWRGLAQRCVAGAAGGILSAGLVLAAWIAMSPALPDAATPAGRQDMAFLSGEHVDALKTGNWNIGAALQAADSIQRYIANDLILVPPHDPNGSHPWQWMVGKGMILYRADRTGAMPMTIGLVPNLVAWLVSLAGLLTSLIPSRLRESPVRAALLAGWLANMAALQWLDGMRVLYLYHYFIPLLLGHAMAAIEWKHHGLPRRPALVLAALAVLAGGLAWPLATGRPVPDWICRTGVSACSTG